MTVYEGKLSDFGILICIVLLVEILVKLTADFVKERLKDMDMRQTQPKAGRNRFQAFLQFHLSVVPLLQSVPNVKIKIQMKMRLMSLHKYKTTLQSKSCRLQSIPATYLLVGQNKKKKQIRNEAEIIKNTLCKDYQTSLSVLLVPGAEVIIVFSVILQKICSEYTLILGALFTSR